MVFDAHETSELNLFQQKIPAYKYMYVFCQC